MNLILVGKIVNTHGIKGEIRIISDFKYKDDVFKIGNNVYIDNKKYTINSYRIHKLFDMITLVDINDINDAIKFKGLNLYIDRDEYKFNGYLDSELIGMDVYYNSEYKGKVTEILKSKMYDLLVVEGKKRHMIPNIDNFVKEIDINNNRIYVEYIGGLDNED